jgi:hypothetical protein
VIGALVNTHKIFLNFVYQIRKWGIGLDYIELFNPPIHMFVIVYN